MSGGTSCEPFDGTSAAEAEAEAADVQWHIRDDFLSRLPALNDSLLSNSATGLLDEFVYLTFTCVLDDDEAVACLRFLLQEEAIWSWTEHGLRIRLPHRAETLMCEGTGRLNDVVLSQLRHRIGLALPANQGS